MTNAVNSAAAEEVERGIFGAPTFFVGDEMFWGNDRLFFVEEALERGGFDPHTREFNHFK